MIWSKGKKRILHDDSSSLVLGRSIFGSHERAMHARQHLVSVFFDLLGSIIRFGRSRLAQRMQ